MSRIMINSNSNYNAHTDPLFESLKVLKTGDLFGKQCMKFWYKYSTNLFCFRVQVQPCNDHVTRSQ